MKGITSPATSLAKAALKPKWLRRDNQDDDDYDDDDDGDDGEEAGRIPAERQLARKLRHAWKAKQFSPKARAATEARCYAKGVGSNGGKVSLETPGQQRRQGVTQKAWGSNGG